MAFWQDIDRAGRFRKLTPFRCYRQLEQSDCGLTCVRMMARYFGRRVSMERLRQMSDMSRQGIAIKDIRDCCSKVGLDTFPVSVTVEELREAPLPAILYWRQNHFVILYSISRSGKRFRIADPAIGKLSLREEEFRQAWAPAESGIAILASPASDFTTAPMETAGVSTGLWRYISRQMKGHGRYFSGVCVLALCCLLAEMALPFLFRRTIDEGLQLRDIGLIWMLLICQAGIFLGSLVSSKWMGWVLVKLGIRLNRSMLSDYLHSISAKTASFFDRRSPPDLIQKMSDQSRIKSFLVSFPQTFLITLLTLLVFSIALFWFDSTVFLIFFGFSLLETLWAAMFLRRRRSIDSGIFQASSENRNLIHEMIHGSQEVRINNASGNKLRQWGESQGKLDSLSMSYERLGIFSNGGVSLLGQVKSLLITGVCATMVAQDLLSLGTMMTIGYITGRLNGPFSTITSGISELQGAGLSHERLRGILSEEDMERGDIRGQGSGIRLEGVSFKYPGASSPYVLRDVSLEVRPGSTVALVGESGCGKSTLIKLMLGFYVPQEGTLQLGDVDVAVLDRQWWLDRCGVVMQNGYIFSDTIASNIAVSEENRPDEERIWESLRTAGMEKFVRQLPMGLHTVIGSAGVELSGGQKQRLLIARAVYRQPDILFLDEATSSLDADNESRIHGRLMSFGKGRTVVVAAHRISTVQNADEILFIKEGRITEHGTHQQLIALGGDYHRLVSRQLQLSV